MKFLEVLIIFSSAFSLTLGQLVLYCYECTSYEEGVDCANYSSAVNYNCYDQLGDFTDGVAVTCYSAYINYTGIQGRESETGVFRGCGIIPDYLGDYCEWYIAELAIYNIPVVSCGGCDSNRCNNHTFDLETGQIIGVAASLSGENRISSSSLSFILSVLSIGLIKYNVF